MDVEKRRKLSLLCGIIAATTIIKRHRRLIRKRRLWAHEWLMRREVEGFYAMTMKELQEKDEIRYSNFLRMDYATFKTLLQLVDPHISRENTTMRLAISSGERLTITLRFLATGEFPKSTVLIQSFGANHRKDCSRNMSSTESCSSRYISTGQRMSYC